MNLYFWLVGIPIGLLIAFHAYVAALRAAARRERTTEAQERLEAWEQHTIWVSVVLGLLVVTLIGLGLRSRSSPQTSLPLVIDVCPIQPSSSAAPRETVLSYMRRNNATEDEIIDYRIQTEGLRNVRTDLLGRGYDHATADAYLLGRVISRVKSRGKGTPPHLDRVMDKCAKRLGYTSMIGPEELEYFGWKQWTDPDVPKASVLFHNKDDPTYSLEVSKDRNTIRTVPMVRSGTHPIMARDIWTPGEGTIVPKKLENLQTKHLSGSVVPNVQ
jgi:hypothetical protein